MRILSPTNDIVFKEFLERELPLLRSMLGAVLGEGVAELTLINNELHGELAYDKTIIVDVRVVLASGKRIIVEIQVLVDPTELKPRLVFYTARDFVNQARRGQERFGSLTPTVTIVWVMVQLWARFLAARTDEERHQLAMEDPIMATATETLERISADPDLVRRAEERELSKFFYESSLVNAAPAAPSPCQVR